MKRLVKKREKQHLNLLMD